MLDVELARRVERERFDNRRFQPVFVVHDQDGFVEMVERARRYHAVGLQLFEGYGVLAGQRVIRSHADSCGNCSHGEAIEAGAVERPDGDERIA